MLRSTILMIILAATIVTASAEALKVYGPGGPLPPIKEAAEIFGKAHDVTIDVVAGPTPQWIDQAKKDSDLIFSGSETMMTDFVRLFEGRIDTVDVVPLYLRASAILVRPSNPGGIHGLKDLFAPGRKVLVVNRAGQNGLWEDMAVTSAISPLSKHCAQTSKYSLATVLMQRKLGSVTDARCLDHMEHLASRKPSACGSSRGRAGT